MNNRKKWISIFAGIMAGIMLLTMVGGIIASVL